MFISATSSVISQTIHNASFGDVVTAIDTGHKLITFGRGAEDIASATDTFVTEEKGIAFNDFVTVIEIYANTGASGLVGSPNEVGTATDTFDVSVDGDTSSTDYAIANDYFVVYKF